MCKMLMDFVKQNYDAMTNMPLLTFEPSFSDKMSLLYEEEIDVLLSC